MTCIDLPTDYDLLLTKVVIAHEWSYQPGEINVAYADGRKMCGLVFVLSGRADYLFAGHPSLTAGPGDVLYLPAHSSYTVQAHAAAPFHHYTVNFHLSNDPDLFLESLSFLFGSQPYLLENSDSDRFQALFAQVVTVWHDKMSGFQLAAKAALYHIFEEFFAQYAHNNQNHDDYVRVLPAKNYIDAHYTEQFTLRLLAELCGISETHFRRLYRSVFGCAPIAYQIQKRMSRAKDLLAMRTYTIGQVAAMTGFSDLNYFSRIFKQKTGVSPKQYQSLN